MIDTKAVGINTGNSLDAVDLVLTEFSSAGEISDLCFESFEFPDSLKSDLRQLRAEIESRDGRMKELIRDYAPAAEVIETYTRFVAEKYSDFVKKLESESLELPSLIGFHGQTCAHFPPSLSKQTGEEPYTIQVGDGQLLANLTGVPVVFDFRSDDVLAGGEGAPLAPLHHRALAEATRKRGDFPIAFCNAGNTGNISILSQDSSGKLLPPLGWDAGPFNDYPDYLCRLEGKGFHDADGRLGTRGEISLPLLELMFREAAVTGSGENFLLLEPPKSSDPQWYRRLAELKGEAPVAGGVLSFADRLRTAEYFSAYVFAHSLGYLPSEYEMPRHFALCGGGWKNPVIREDFIALVQGNSRPVLDEHAARFAEIRSRFPEPPKAAFSLEYGFDGQAMEARLFAHAACAFIEGEPFSLPETTGVDAGTVLGLLCLPDGMSAEVLDGLTSPERLAELQKIADSKVERRWSRAAADSER